MRSRERRRSITDRLCDPCRGHFDGVQDGLKDAGLSWVLEPTLVRGLDYYTRTAFEFVSPALSPQQATLFGGGRYDGLAEVLGGPHVPGVGFGMGLDRVLMAIEEEGLAPPEEPGLTVFVVGVGDAGRARALEPRAGASRGRRRRGHRLRGPAAEGAAEDGGPRRRRPTRRSSGSASSRRYRDRSGGSRTGSRRTWRRRPGRRLLGTGGAPAGMRGSDEHLPHRDADPRLWGAHGRARRTPPSSSAAGSPAAGTTAASPSSTCAIARASPRWCSIRRRPRTRTRRRNG